MNISVDKRFALLAAMGACIEWDLLTAEQVQAGIKNPGLLGKQATFFIQMGHQVQIGGCFFETGELSVQIPGINRPNLAYVQSKYDWIQSIERDDSTEAPVTLALATLIPGDEGSIGTEYEKCVALKRDVLLGFQHREWLLRHQHEFPEFMALLGNFYIDFPGMVAIRFDGHRRVPSCNQSGSSWDDCWHWLSSSFDSDGRIAFGK